MIPKSLVALTLIQKSFRPCVFTQAWGEPKKGDAKINGQQKGSEPSAGSLLLMKDNEVDGFTVYK